MTNSLDSEPEPGKILCGCGNGFIHENHLCPWEDMRCANDGDTCSCCVMCQFSCMGESDYDTDESDDDEDYDEDYE